MKKSWRARPTARSTEHGHHCSSGGRSGRSRLPRITNTRHGSTLSPRLVVTRGQKINEEFHYSTAKTISAALDEKPVDINLELGTRIASGRGASMRCLSGLRQLTIEDLNSSNGTFVNRSRIQAGDKYPLKNGDVIQVGTVQLKVKM